MGLSTKPLSEQFRFCLFACVAGTILAYMALIPLWREGLTDRSGITLLLVPPMMFGWIALCIAPLKGGWFARNPLVPGLLGSLIICTLFLCLLWFQL
ncbi:MAG: hypothetical protein EXR99_06285 [Gemmataceae bacterium]|nr:hypothetical protein [Gemmataceae bacterium]